MPSVKNFPSHDRRPPAFLYFLTPNSNETVRSIAFVSPHQANVWCRVRTREYRSTVFVTFYFIFFMIFQQSALRQSCSFFFHFRHIFNLQLQMGRPGVPFLYDVYGSKHCPCDGTGQEAAVNEPCACHFMMREIRFHSHIPFRSLAHVRPFAVVGGGGEWMSTRERER